MAKRKNDTKTLELATPSLEGDATVCLGKKFESQEDRRNHFLGELRRLLENGEIQNTEGFPDGDVDKILAMSDPPYYTACPNPFISTFVQQHTNERAEHQGEYQRKPFSSDVSEGRTDPIYNAHAYHTKVPYKAIMHYILHYTEPGDLVFDGFCGTGMTGVAAQMCGDSSVLESIGYTENGKGTLASHHHDHGGGLTIQRGSRKAIISDLSPVASFIASNYCRPFNVNEFSELGGEILRVLEKEIGWMYSTVHNNQTRARINYTVWSDVYSCPHCAKEVVFLDVAFNMQTKKIRESFDCPSCSVELSKDDLELQYTSSLDPADQKPTRFPKRKPVIINYSVGKKKFDKKPDEGDLEVLKRIEQMALPECVPTEELPDSQMRRVGRMKPTAVRRIHHFFHSRPRHALSLLWKEANKVTDARMRHVTLFFVEQAIWTMSLLNRFRPSGYSQVNQYLSGVFYVPSQHSEVSPFYVLEGKLKRLISAFTRFPLSRHSVFTSVSDCANTQIPSKTIDYIFTDPPFGENIYYADLNQLIESWHGVKTANKREAIIDRVRSKTLFDYQKMMADAFKEYYRVLKPGRWITVEFHNSKNSVWNSIQEALQSSGFVIADVRMLDKQQGSFQQVTSRGAVKRDLVISAYRPDEQLEKQFDVQSNMEGGVWDFIRNHLKKLPIFVSSGEGIETISERQSFLLFDRMVAFYVQHGISVPISASEFYAGLEQRYAFRDGMYFLSDQVPEYDKKRLSVKEVKQLSLFVSDEASGIQWLKQQLHRKPQTFQELHPIFMKEIAGWNKNETPLELAHLLEQNFLRYDENEDVPSQVHGYLSSNYKKLRGVAKHDSTLKAKAKDRWYVPDPGKAGDLEKLREKALLKEFAEYIQEKKKLKIFRFEAVRAGFKNAWQERDYETIIAVARKIPDKILQEDPKLLMWYDQALTRAGEDA